VGRSPHDASADPRCNGVTGKGAGSEVVMKPHRIAKLHSAQSSLVGTLLLAAVCAHTAGTPAAQATDRARVEPGIELEYRVRGTGEPVC
jgi:hypothetical protein